MSDFEIVRDGIGWSDDSPESEQAYAEALAALDRIEAEVAHAQEWAEKSTEHATDLAAEVERLRQTLADYEAGSRMRDTLEQAHLDEVERLRAALESIGGLRDPYLESEEEISAFARAALAKEP